VTLSVVTGSFSTIIFLLTVSLKKKAARGHPHLCGSSGIIGTSWHHQKKQVGANQHKMRRHKFGRHKFDMQHVKKKNQDKIERCEFARESTCVFPRMLRREGVRPSFAAGFVTGMDGSR
jgi:hypothetical protein